MTRSSIEWTDETLPVTVGCKPVSKGCMYCWAARMAAGRLCWNPLYKGLAVPGDPPRWTGEIRFNPDCLEPVYGWRKPRRVFVAPMGDLFNLLPGQLTQVFETIRDNPEHDFQVLTKRPVMMTGFFENVWTGSIPENAWIGVSAEDNRTFLNRMRLLDKIDALVKWISLEPLLGPIRLDNYRPLSSHLSWVVVGGETGRHARPMHEGWVDDIRRVCALDNVPFFFKQWGEWIPNSQLDLPSGTQYAWGGDFEDLYSCSSRITNRDPRSKMIGGEHVHNYPVTRKGLECQP